MVISLGFSLRLFFLECFNYCLFFWMFSVFFWLFLGCFQSFLVISKVWGSLGAPGKRATSGVLPLQKPVHT